MQCCAGRSRGLAGAGPEVGLLVPLPSERQRGHQEAWDCGFSHDIDCLAFLLRFGLCLPVVARSALPTVIINSVVEYSQDTCWHFLKM